MSQLTRGVVVRKSRRLEAAPHGSVKLQLPYSREAAKFADKIKKERSANFFFASFERRNLNIKARICKFANFHMSQPTRGVLIEHKSVANFTQFNTGLVRENAGIY
jgi:hypothetical protein